MVESSFQTGNSVYEAWGDPSSRRFLFVVQVVAKLDMLPGGLFLLFQCARSENEN